MKKLNLVVSLPNDNSYQREQAKAARETATKFGADVRIVHADNDAVAQSQQLLEIVQSNSSRRPDAIFFEPLTATGLVRVGEAAVKAGISWVVLNSDVDYMDRLRAASNVPVFTVTRDHTEIGRVQARQFAALLPDGGTVLYIQGPATNSAAAQRTIGLESARPANIHLKQLRSQWTEESAYETVNAWLRLSTSRASSIDVVGCQYDGIAMGARKAFLDHADSSERDRWSAVPFTGVDGLPTEGQAWVKRGTLAATVISPTTTQKAIEILATAIDRGAQPPERTLIELSSYPPLDQLSAQGKRSAAQKKGAAS
jgi:ABC-type sugar transport system substrate-binding protein